MREEFYIKSIDKSLNFNMLKENLNLYPDDIVYIGGSLIDGEINKYSDGLGNKYSDIDVFIIRENSKFNLSTSTYEGVFKKIDFLNLPEFGVDIEIYNRTLVESLILSVSNIKFESSSRITNSFVFEDGMDYSDIETFFNRLYNSICLFNNEEFNLMKERIELHKWLLLQQYLINNQIENLFADIVGNIEASNFEVAIACTREAYLLLIKYIVFSLGDTVDRDKWLPIKLKNIVKYHPCYKDLEKVYNNLFFGYLKDDAIKKKICQDVLKFIQSVIEEDTMGELL